jgi:hypothetical protein
MVQWVVAVMDTVRWEVVGKDTVQWLAVGMDTVCWEVVGEGLGMDTAVEDCVLEDMVH